MPSDQQKWIISIISALLFYIIALPQTYECLTNPIVESLTGVELEKKGKPTKKKTQRMMEEYIKLKKNMFMNKFFYRLIGDKASYEKLRRL